MSRLPTKEQTPPVVGARRLPGPARPGGGPPSSEGGFTAKDLIRMVRKRIWLILICLLAVASITVAATVLWAFYAPSYGATAYLRVNPVASNPLDNERIRVNEDEMERLKATLARNIKSEAVFLRAEKDPRLRRSNWYQTNSQKGDMVQVYYDEINVTPVPGEEYVALSLTNVARSEEQQAEVADVVTAIADAAVAELAEQTNRSVRQQIESLETQKDSNLESLKDVSDQIGVLRKQYPAIEKRRDALDIELQTLVPQKANLEIEQRAAETALKLAEQQQRQGTLAQAPEVQAIVQADRQLAALRAQETDLSTALDDALRKFGPRHRTVLTLQTRLESIRQSRAQREQEVTQSAMTAYLEGMRSQSAAMSEQLRDIVRSMGQIESALRDAMVGYSRLEELKSQQDRLVRRLDQVDQGIQDLQLKNRAQPPLTVARQAEKPRERAQPKFSIMIPLGVFLGLVVGFGLAFLLEFADSSVKSPADLTRRVDLPILGMVPHSDDVEDPVPNLALAFMSHPNSLMSEAFRQIRTCLLFSGPAEGRKCLLVTSPMPEDGRTTVAMNLAGSMAVSGRRVLLIDTNFRQPAIKTLFPQTAADGLANVLVGQGQWRDLIHEVADNLHVMPAGPVPPNPAELLDSEQMANLLEEVGQEFDQIILDGAPALVVSDAVALSTRVDGVIVAVRAGSNSYGIVQRTKSTLDRVGAHIIGVVINGVRVTAGGYLRKNYETFYEYHAGAPMLPRR